MRLYTIGYATKAVTNFLDQLKTNDIHVVVDVRSVPYSAAFYDYHREQIQTLLKNFGIRYLYLGTELGPRSKDPSHYDESGQVQFKKLMLSDLFSGGIRRLQDGLRKGYRIALMCAEKDPAICHRSLLIGYYLKHQLEIDTVHIHHDGDQETQTQLEQRLIQLNQLVVDLLSDDNDLAERAYQMQLLKTSYRKPLS